MTSWNELTQSDWRLGYWSSVLYCTSASKVNRKQPVQNYVARTRRQLTDPITPGPADLHCQPLEYQIHKIVVITFKLLAIYTQDPSYLIVNNCVSDSIYIYLLILRSLRNYIGLYTYLFRYHAPILQLRSDGRDLLHVDRVYTPHWWNGLSALHLQFETVCDNT